MRFRKDVMEREGLVKELSVDDGESIDDREDDFNDGEGGFVDEEGVVSGEGGFVNGESVNNGEGGFVDGESVVAHGNFLFLLILLVI